jgi:molecular chaperone HtpG
LLFLVLKNFRKYKDSEKIQELWSFGLGFYSAFMVASKWRSSLNHTKMSLQHIGHATEVLSLHSADKTTRGTEIILHIAEFFRIP